MIEEFKTFHSGGLDNYISIFILANVPNLIPYYLQINQLIGVCCINDAFGSLV